MTLAAITLLVGTISASLATWMGLHRAHKKDREAARAAAAAAVIAASRDEREYIVEALEAVRALNSVLQTNQKVSREEARVDALEFRDSLRECMTRATQLLAERDEARRERDEIKREFAAFRYRFEQSDQLPKEI